MTRPHANLHANMHANLHANGHSDARANAQAMPLAAPSQPAPKLQVAVVGLGQVGRACAEALLASEQLALAGIVRRADTRGVMPAHLQPYPAVTHISELPLARVALVCVPALDVLGVARELLQARMPVVECASFEDQALREHHAALHLAADKHHVAAVVAAGWEPGLLSVLRGAFEMLIPQGRTHFHRHPGISLHHTAAAARVPGVKDALAGQYRGEHGAPQHLVYVELAPQASLQNVQNAIAADPLFAGESTQVFEVAHVSELEGEDGQGVLLERLGSGNHGPHPTLLLEARLDNIAFTARTMLDAARAIPALPRGAHRYALGM